MRRLAGTAWRPRSVPWSKRICATGSTCAKLAYLHFLRRIAASKALRANEWKERPGDRDGQQAWREGAASVAGASGHEGGPSTAAAHAKQAAARVAPVNH